MACKYSMFSKMKWLDKEIERNSKSVGRNYYSDCYYKRFLDIREAQENGSVSDDTYCDTPVYMGSKNPEEGYYMANIHYDMFIDDALEAEKRTLHFLINSDPNVLRHNSTLKQFILSDIEFFIVRRYDRNIPIDGPSKIRFEYYGNDIEKEILRIYNEIYPDRPIINRVEFEIFDITKKKCKKYIFDINEKFNIIVSPLNSNGKVLNKQSYQTKYMNITSNNLEEYFTELYSLLGSNLYDCCYKMKGCKKFIKIKVFYEGYITRTYQYSNDKKEKYISLLSKFLIRNTI